MWSESVVCRGGEERDPLDARWSHVEILVTRASCECVPVLLRAHHAEKRERGRADRDARARERERRQPPPYVVARESRVWLCGAGPVPCVRVGLSVSLWLCAASGYPRCGAAAGSEAGSLVARARVAQAARGQDGRSPGTD